MKTALALLALAAGSAAQQSCPSMLPTGFTANTAFQMKAPYNGEALWKPYFQLKDANGNVLGKLQTQCPKIERTLGYTDATTGESIFTATTKLGIVSLANGNWGETDVTDCNGAVISKITTSFSQSFLQRYAFQTDFTVVNSGGATIGSVSGSNIGNGFVTITNSSGYGVANIQWSWGNRFYFINAFMTLTFLGSEADTLQSGIAPETVMTIAELAFTRVAMSSDSFMDNCSRFIIVGIPVMVIINSLALCVFVGAARNKFIGLLAGLLFFPILAYIAAVSLVALIICFFIKLPWMIGQLLVTPLVCCGRRQARESVDRAFSCLDTMPVMQGAMALNTLPLKAVFDK